MTNTDWPTLLAGGGLTLAGVFANMAWSALSEHRRNARDDNLRFIEDRRHAYQEFLLDVRSLRTQTTTSPEFDAALTSLILTAANEVMEAAKTLMNEIHIADPNNRASTKAALEAYVAVCRRDLGFGKKIETEFILFDQDDPPDVPRQQMQSGSP